MKYQRKTVDRYQYNLLLIIIMALTTVLAFVWLDMAADKVRAQEFVSPVSNAIIVDREIPVEVISYQHPQTIEDKIKALWPDDWETAMRVFKCESGLNPNATNHNKNGSIDVGIAQINSVHGVSAAMLKDVDVNLAVARQVYDNAGGWTPWVCYTRGLHE